MQANCQTVPGVTYKCFIVCVHDVNFCLQVQLICTFVVSSAVLHVGGGLGHSVQPLHGGHPQQDCGEL